ncbi:MAG: hypothetical protein ABJC24_09735 [Chloroflexota bacterium]
MDFSKLSANEKLATYSAVALVIAGIISNWGGLLWLSILAGLAALVVIFLPQMSPTTSLPGSKGSLLVALGGIAAAGAVIEILRYLSYFFNTLGDYQTLLFLVALVAALVLAWAGWQFFQAEGGKFTVGMTGSAPAPSPAPPAEATPTAPMAPPTPAAPPAEPMRNDEPMSSPPSAGPPPMGGTEDDRT